MNSVSRLYDVLSKIKESPKEYQLYKVLCEYYDIDDRHDKRYPTLMAKFFSLPANAENLIKRFPRKFKPEVHLTWVSPVTNFFFSTTLQGKVEQIRTIIPQLETLAVVAHSVEGEVGDKRVQREEIEGLKEAIWELIEEIEGSCDLSDAVKAYILEQCFKLLDGLEDVLYFGDEKIELAVESVFGSIIANQEVAKGAVNNESGKKLWEIIGRINIVVSISKNVMSLPGLVENFLKSSS